jgi:hypothetical protein
MVFQIVFSTVQRRIPFGRIHDSPIPFDSANRRCFMPGQRINVQISRVEQTDQTQLLKSNLSVIITCNEQYIILIATGEKVAGPYMFRLPLL